MALAAGLPVLLRLLLLPLLPVPRPGVPDEFSNLLAADTFAHFRLANPPLAFGEFFESFHILIAPTYASMYPVGQGFFLFLGRVIFGVPWAGVVLSVALMCGAVCWLLEGVLPGRWALAGGLAFGLLFGVESYWMNSYWGGAASAIGGALAAGGVLRLVKRGPPPRHPSLLGALAGSGAAVLLHTRPWEGFCLTLPCGLVLLAWVFRAKRPKRLVTVVLPAALALGAGLALFFHDNLQVTGDPFTPPYLLNLRRYYVAPLFAWDTEKPVPDYPTDAMRRFYAGWRESEASLRASGDARDPARILFAWFHELKFCGGAILACLVCAAALRFRGKSRLLLGLFACVLAGLAVTRVQQLHYLGPAAGLFVAVQMQGLRALGAVRIAGRRFGRALPLIVVLAAAVGLTRNVALTLRRPGRDYADRRASLLARLDALGGRHLVLVSYGRGHVPHDEWVYNGADLGEAPVVFAHARSPAENEELLAHFPSRRAWLLRPENDDEMEPYRRP